MNHTENTSNKFAHLSQLLYHSFIKQQFIAIHTVSQTDIPALPDSRLQTHLLSKCRVRKELLLFILLYKYTGLFEMIVGVLTTCHTLQIAVYIFFYLIEQHSKVLLHTLQVLYMCTVCDSADFNTIIEFVPNCL